MKKFDFFLGLMLVLAIYPTDNGAAAEHEEVRKAVIAGKYKPLADILSMVQKKYRGRVLDVELEHEPGLRHVYEVKLLNARGVRQEIHIDAVTGEEVDLLTTPRLQPLSASLRKLQAQYPGRVIDVDLKKNSRGESFYQVRLLQQDGEIRSVFMDAATGSLISEVDELRTLPDMMSLADLLDALDGTPEGTVMEAELKYDRSRRAFYEIKLLRRDGLLTEIWVDPGTARVLSEEDLEGL